MCDSYTLGAVWCGVVLSGVVWCVGVVWCAGLCCAVVCCAALCCAVLCCAVLCCAVRVCCDVMWSVVCVCVCARRSAVCVCVRGGGGEEERCVVSKNKNPTLRMWGTTKGTANFQTLNQPAQPKLWWAWWTTTATLSRNQRPWQTY